MSKASQSADSQCESYHGFYESWNRFWDCWPTVVGSAGYRRSRQRSVSRMAMKALNKRAEARKIYSRKPFGLEETVVELVVPSNISQCRRVWTAQDNVPACLLCFLVVTTTEHRQGSALQVVDGRELEVILFGGTHSFYRDALVRQNRTYHIPRCLYKSRRRPRLA